MKNKKGFTLIELLIVIAIIAILAAVIFVALDPLTRFQDSRDSARWQEVSAIANAIQVDQVDNGGTYLTAIDDLTNGSTYMIVDGSMDIGCDDNNTYCDIDVSGDAYCVDLSGLVDEGYLGDVPISSTGDVIWDDGDVDGEEGTGYTLTASSTGIITIRACESENSTEIEISR
jgi:prepilin-type N-terminal cleavage/methylation domain-containing protein